MHNYRMYVIAIGWLYVATLMALTETSVAAGVLAFTCWGALPTALLFWLGGAKARRQRRQHREETAARLLANQGASQGDGTHAKADQ